VIRHAAFHANHRSAVERHELHGTASVVRQKFFALDHEGERPKGMTLAVGTVTGGLAATAVSKGERAGKGVGGHFETGEQLTLALPKTIGGRAGGKGSHLYLPVMIHADQKQSK
jgi:hypothetical protein